jgi:hypothetical protein
MFACAARWRDLAVRTGEARMALALAVICPVLICGGSMATAIFLGSARRRHLAVGA